MVIYTGNTYGKKFQKILDTGLGIMISTHSSFKPQEYFKQVPCALDNGAFPAWNKGHPFPEKTFLETIEQCYSLDIKLDFIVCPDIVAGGKKSLDFSMEWAHGKLRGVRNLALPLQDGMSPSNFDHYDRSLFSHFFLGGTKKWKWQTLPIWMAACKSWNKPLHVGRCGTLDKMLLCYNFGVNSIDSTNFTRNNSWKVLEEYKKSMQELNTGR